MTDTFRHVADVHCDLLEFLENKKGSTPFDETAHCSIPQMKRGGVSFQVLAVYTSTGSESVKKGMGQVAIFPGLPSKYANDFYHVKSSDDILKAEKEGKIGIMLALENASSFSGEEEPLKKMLARLAEIAKKAGPILYISLTHFGENRFGGGNMTQGVGLKKDGEELLRYISGKKIAMDISHASDDTAFGILNFIDKHGLNIPIIASHSNFRKIADHSRNLPDEIAREIIKRKGLIGINFVRDFIGAEGHEYFLRQIEYALKIGASENLCFGADFCDAASVIKYFNMPPDYQIYYDEFGAADCYPRLISYIKDGLRLDERLLQNIAKENVVKYIKHNIA